MNILLLGGTGTLSSAVRDLSINKGYNVTIFNRGKSVDIIPDKVKLVVGDFKKRESLECSIAQTNYDVVVDFLSRNTADIDRVFSIFQGRCTQYLFISTACVYNRSNAKKRLTEDAPKPNMKWSYSVEKYNCEQRLKELQNENSNTYYTIVRPYITYDRQRIPLGISPIPYSLHGTIVERIKSGKPLFIWDGGKNVTTTTYVKDFALGVIGLFLNPNAKNEDFHITSSNTCTHRLLLEKLFQKLHVSPNIIDVKTSEICECLPEYKDMLLADRALDAQFDNSKIKAVVKDLNFETSIDQGLDIVLEYWEHVSTYKYDYQFEGRIDRLLSRHTKVGYVRYAYAKRSSLVVYLLYRYLPLKWAKKISLLCHS